MTGICALLLFTKVINLILILFGIFSLFQVIVSVWVIVRSAILMKLGE